ncbi:MAG: hypothetical protein P4L87_09800 [Formivibrio sp.]|nr:hypothetical protein [Formivibrio sp.]
MAEKWLYLSKEYRDKNGSYSIEIDGDWIEYCQVTRGETLEKPFELVAKISEETFSFAARGKRIRFNPINP